jgi:5-methyltetrahydrofolate--homocysteine methyltransferase
LENSYFEAAKGLIEGGSDGLLIETTQDLLQAKAAVNGSRRAIASTKKDIVLIAQVTIETNGTMLLGSEIGAALNSLGALKIDLIGLNCATGPTEMSEHLRYLSKHTTIPISCMPNAGLPVLEDGGARYPLQPKEFSDALVGFVNNYGVRLVGGCCGTTPEHLLELVTSIRKLNDQAQTFEREVMPDSGASSIYQYVSFRQDQTYLSIGERANANGSKAFRDALLEENWDKCIEIAKEQIRDGAHFLDLSVIMWGEMAPKICVRSRHD